MHQCGIPAFLFILLTFSPAPLLADDIQSELEPFSGPIISIDLEEADMRSTLQLFAELYKTNIIADRDVVGKVNLRLQDVALDEAFHVFLRMYNLYPERSERVTIVRPIKKYIELARP